jgi:hypothetical protein
MRIDLFTGGKRPWYFGLMLKVATFRLGILPGPPATLSFRPDFFDRQLIGFLLRNTSTRSLWGKGPAELVAAFVSNLNTCHF